MDFLGVLLVAGAANFAISLIITESTLFAPLRSWLGTWNEKLDDLINCPVCIGTYVGGFLAFVFVYSQDYGPTLRTLLIGIAFAFGSLGVALMLRKYFDQ